MPVTGISPGAYVNLSQGFKIMLDLIFDCRLKFLNFTNLFLPKIITSIVKRNWLKCIHPPWFIGFALNIFKLRHFEGKQQKDYQLCCTWSFQILLCFFKMSLTPHIENIKGIKCKYHSWYHYIYQQTRSPYCFQLWVYDYCKLIINYFFFTVGNRESLLMVYPLYLCI